MFCCSVVYNSKCLFGFTARRSQVQITVWNLHLPFSARVLSRNSSFLPLAKNISMWPCDKLATCPGCNAAITLWQLGQPPTAWAQEKWWLENGWIDAWMNGWVSLGGSSWICRWQRQKTGSLLIHITSHSSCRSQAICKSDKLEYCWY